MKLTVERSDLAAAMQRARSVVGNKNVQILSNVMLTAADNRLTIRATNLDIEAVEEIAADISEPGETTVPAETLSEIARNMPAGAVIGMTIDGPRLKVTSGRSRFNLGMLPAADFPSFGAHDLPFRFTIRTDALSAMIDRVSFAQSTSPARQYLCGVRLEHADGRLRMVATDGLALAYVDGPDVADFDGVTMPSALVTILANMPDAADEIEIALSKTMLTATGGNSSMSGKLIDPSLAFPAYGRVIPKNNTITATVDREAMTGAIRRALIAAKGTKDNPVAVVFNPGAVSVAGRDDISDAFDEIEAEYTADELRLVLNPNYMLPAFAALGGENLHLAMKDAASPVLVVAADGAVVLVPMRG